MADPRVGFCVFCDNIRQEAGNKVSLMGIYGTDMYFAGAKPGNLPTFAVIAYLICDADDKPKQLKLRIIGTDKTELINSDMPLSIPTNMRPDAQKLTIQVMSQLTNLTIADEGDIEVYLDTETGSVRAGRLAIKFFPVVNVAPDLSSAPTPPEKPRPAVARRSRRRL